MNSSDSPDPAMPAVNPITRRNFMKKTALTAGAITLLGQGVGFADPSSASQNVWWQDFKKTTYFSSQVAGAQNDDAGEILESMLSDIHSRDPGTPDGPAHLAPGGKLISPPRCSPITASATGNNPAMMFNSTTGIWGGTFTPDYVYRVSYRE